MMRRVLVGLVAALAVLALAGCGAPHTYSGTLLEPGKPVSDFTIADQHGQPFQLSAQRGKVTLLYFGYTNCPDFCPSTMGDWKQVRAKLGKDAERVQFVMISTDPERDTPQVLGDYLSTFDPAILGLQPTMEQLQALSTEYGVGVDQPEDGAHEHDPSMHGSYTYAIDPAGQWRVVWRFGIEPQEIADDVRALLSSS